MAPLVRRSPQELLHGIGDNDALASCVAGVLVGEVAVVTLLIAVCDAIAAARTQGAVGVAAVVRAVVVLPRIALFAECRVQRAVTARGWQDTPGCTGFRIGLAQVSAQVYAVVASLVSV